MKIIPYIVQRDAARLAAITPRIFDDIDPYDIDDLKTFRGWVLVDDSVVVGACLYRKDTILTSKREQWYFAYIGMLPRYQGKGHGSEMLQKLLAKADIARAYLVCDTVSERAQRLYEKNDFSVVSTGEIVVMRRRPARTA